MKNVITIETAMPDVHKRRAVKEFGVAYDEVTPDQRRAAKALNFGDLYGMPRKALIDSLDTTQEIRDTLLAEAKAEAGGGATKP